MSAGDSTTTIRNTRTSRTRNNNHHSPFDRKRKLEDSDCATSSDINGAPRPRKPASNSNSKGKRVIDAAASAGQSSGGGDASVALEYTPRAQLQFFVKLLNGGKTLVLRADFGDTVEMVHKKIMLVTGIPLCEQRLIYRGRQLQWDQTLESCGVQNDAGMQLVGRMRSTDNPLAWGVISDLVDVICSLCRNEISLLDNSIIKDKLEQFVGLPSRKDKYSVFVGRKSIKRDAFGNEVVDDDDDDEEDEEDVGVYNVVSGGAIRAVRSSGEDRKMAYYKIFMDACAPQALVMMYKSSDKKNRECAEECIKWFVSYMKSVAATREERTYIATIVLEFCRLLATKGDDYKRDELYVHCRSTLGSMLEKVEVASRDMGDLGVEGGEFTFIAVQDVFPLLTEVGKSLVKDLASSVDPTHSTQQLLRDVCDFSAFLRPLLGFIGKELAAVAAARKGKGKGRFSPLGDEVERLFLLFSDLLSGILKCLAKMELCLAVTKKDGVVSRCGWPQYLIILKELSSIAVLYPGSEDRFWAIMRQNKVALRALVVRYASRADDHGWLLKHKDILDFESRRLLAMLMFPEVREDYEELHEMLIDRAQLLSESFEYISGAEPSSLHAGLFMEFKNEEATGPGVLREWFCLVTQAIFDPQNALFVTCPLDRRRFYPNPASKVDPLHLRYFRFSGRVIALALMHKIQVGVVLDRVFFLQLAGKCVSLEDIKDADPCIYNSCKQILEMDPEFVDSDALGLTFVTELEELGSRKIMELCPGGKGLVVNSKNRKEYVHLIVQHRFVSSVRDQVTSFGQGFSDILRDGKLRTTFFESLEPEDLDWMLHGSGSDISVEDWKAHTEYHGYKKSDPQIVWFWEVVGQLSAEQKKTLLFFWTSVKYLPIEGFRCLASRVYIYKSLEPQDRLPSSHTCFYRLCIPPYSTKGIMQNRLQVITQEHVGCSFGTW